MGDGGLAACDFSRMQEVLPASQAARSQSPIQLVFQSFTHYIKILNMNYIILFHLLYSLSYDFI